jgi:hypothetical protein
MPLPLPGKLLVLTAILFAELCGASAGLRAQGVLVPVTERSDMVFDHGGKYLYITTTDGWVRRYNLATGKLEPGYNLGGSLGGVDIAADDSFLLVAQRTTPSNAQGVVHKLDLRTGVVTNAYYNSDNDRGSNDVAIASNGTALVTSATTNGFAFTRLRQWDLSTNALTERLDTPGIGPGGSISVGAWLTRSEDGTRLSISTDAGSNCFTYSALSNTFSESGSWSSQRTALNRDGTLAATLFRNNGNVSLDTVPDYGFVHAFPGLGGFGPSGGVAFDPTTDVLYAVSVNSNEIVAYDAKTFVEQSRLSVGEELVAPDSPSVFVANHDGHLVALATDLGVRLFAIPVGIQPPPTPVFNLPTDMVFDHAGTRLYINTIFGQVWPYNLLTGNLEAPFDLGGSLVGMDIAPDDSFLLVAQYYRGVKEAMFQKIDLKGRAVTNLNYRVQYLGFDYPDGGGAWDVAIGSQGLALASSHPGSGWISLLQIDPATNAVSIRTDAPASGFGGTIRGKTIIHRSADQKRLLFLESGSSEGRMFTYDAITNSFGPYYNSGDYFDFNPGAINRDGSLVAMRDKVLSAPDLTVLRTFSALGESGIAFDAAKDILYKVQQSQVVAYDTNDFTEKFRLNIGETLSSDWTYFNVGNLVASQDGNYLALITPTTLRVLNVTTGAVAALPTPPSAPSKGQLANISTRAFVNNGDNVTIAGFILRGQYPEKMFLRAIGPSLTTVGVPGAMEDPTLELYDSSGVLVAMNDNWKDSPSQIQIVSAGLSPKDNREACIVATLDPGAYTAVLRGKNQTTGNALVELYDGGPQFTGTHQLLSNISTRGLVGVDDNAMIAGLITTGGSRILVRGIGPSLAAFNVPDPLQNPMIELRNSNGALMTANDNWQDTQRAEIWNTGIAPTSDLESALISTVPSGSYTAILRGKENGTGNGLVEIYQMQ